MPGSRAGKIWYVALTQRLQHDADFQTAADTTFAVAGDLFGAWQPQQQAVQAGWNGVGMTVNPAGLRVNPGMGKPEGQPAGTPSVGQPPKENQHQSVGRVRSEFADVAD